MAESKAPGQGSDNTAAAAALAKPVALSSAKMDAILNLYATAASDEQRFAALMLIAKTADATDTAVITKIYETVKFEFINRLLASAERHLRPRATGDEDASEAPASEQPNERTAIAQLYRELALGILAVYSPHPHIASHPQFLDKCHILLSVVEEGMSRKPCNSSPSAPSATTNETTRTNETTVPGMSSEPSTTTGAAESPESKASSAASMATSSEPTVDTTTTTTPSSPSDLSDAIRCLLGISSTAEGRMLLQQDEYLGRLCALPFGTATLAVSDFECLMTVILQLMLRGRVLSSDASSRISDIAHNRIAEDNACDPKLSSGAVIRLLRLLSSVFRERQDEVKLIACRAVIAAINAIRAVYTEQSTAFKEFLKDNVWVEDVRLGLWAMICSRLSSAMRSAALSLAAYVVELHGITWTRLSIGALDGEKQPGDLFFLLTQLCCVEVRMCLEEQPFAEVVKAKDLLTACFVILEAAIVFLTVEDDAGIVAEREALVSSERQAKLRLALSGLGRSCISFFETLQEHGVSSVPWSGTSDPLTLITQGVLRVLAVWLAEETEALRAEVVNVLSTLLQAIRRADSLIFPCLLLYLPALCHLTAEDDARVVIMREQYHNFIGQQLISAWLPQLEEACLRSASTQSGGQQHTSDSSPKRSRKGLTEPEPDHNTESKIVSLGNSVATAVGVLLNICVLEPAAVQHDAIFPKLFSKCSELAKSCSFKDAAPFAYLNVLVLGTMLADRLASVLASSDISLVEMFSVSLQAIVDYSKSNSSQGETTSLLLMLCRDIADSVSRHPNIRQLLRQSPVSRAFLVSNLPPLAGGRQGQTAASEEPSDDEEFAKALQVLSLQLSGASG